MAFYIYNGIRLPRLDGYLKTASYLTLEYIPDSEGVFPYWLTWSSTKPCATTLTSGSSSGNIVIRDEDEYHRGGSASHDEVYGWWFDSNEFALGEGGWIWGGTKEEFKREIVWTNYDLYLDGELYMKGTQPIEAAYDAECMSDNMRRFIFQHIYNSLGEHEAGALKSHCWQRPTLLYGTPSPIAIAYNGVELPELPYWEKDKYPYAFLSTNSSGTIYLRCLPKQLTYGTYTAGGVTYTRSYLYIAAGESMRYQYAYLTADNVWTVVTDSIYDRSELTNGSYYSWTTEFWANYDIVNKNDSSVHLAASEPVYTVTGDIARLVEGASYNSVELPVLPEWDKSKYPYAYITVSSKKKLNCLPVPINYGTWVSNTGYEYTKLHFIVEPGNVVSFIQFTFDDEKGCWGAPKETVIDRSTATINYYAHFSYIEWCNTNIPNLDDGTVYLTASEPTEAELIVYYKGAALPKIPGWDKATYPYAYITGGSKLLVSPRPAQYGTYTTNAGNSNTRCYFKAEAGEVLKIYQFPSDNGVWGEPKELVFDQSEATAPHYANFDCVWANTDIPNTDDGSIYLAACEPIKLASPEPVAAVYNGVELPELPEWDKSVYPYAYITKNSSGVIRILCSYIPLEYGTYSSSGTDYTKIYLNIPKGEYSTTWNFDLAENAWGEGYERSWDRTGNDLNYKLTFASVIWCNTDIPNIDNNTTYLAASEPVPVYE